MHFLQLQDIRKLVLLVLSQKNCMPIKSDDWSARKPSTPYGELPVIEIEGEGVLAQSNAILGLIGKRYDLLPQDDFKAAQHYGILSAVEDLSMRISHTISIEDDAEKKKSREKLADGYMKHWAANMEKQIQGPYVARDRISVADIKLFVMLSWVRQGILDHIPSNYFDGYPKLNALYEAVSAHPKIIEWYKNK